MYVSGAAVTLTPKSIVTEECTIVPFGDVGDERFQTPHSGLDPPTRASTGDVRAAPLVSIELVAANLNEGGKFAWITTPEALPGPRFCTVTVKSPSVVPGVNAPEKSGVMVTESCAASVLHEDRRIAVGASTETATIAASRDAGAHTRLIRETVRSCSRSAAARAADAAGWR